MGRFLTKDPFPGFLSSPSTQHSDSYALNNPTNLVDPSGRNPLLAAMGIAGIIGGIAAGISHALSNPCQSLGDMLRSPDFWKSVAVGVAAGLVSGLLIGGLGGLGILGTGFLETVGIGAFTGGVTGGFAEGLGQLLTHGRIVDPGAILTASLFGAITGGIFSAVGYGIGKAVRMISSRMTNIRLNGSVKTTSTNRMLPAPKGQNPWKGDILSTVTEQEEVFYRVWGNDGSRVGKWLSRFRPLSAAQARSGLALPPSNSAQFISEVRVPAGTRVQIGFVGDAFDQTGGWLQIELLERIPKSAFGQGEILPFGLLSAP